MQKLDLPETSLVSGLLERKLFKRLWTISPDTDDKRWRDIVKHWDDLPRDKKHRCSVEFEKAIAKKMVAPTPVTSLSPEDAHERIATSTAGRIPWLLIDIPGGRPGSEIGLYCVLESQGRRLRKDDHVVGELQRSAVWDKYARDLQEVAGKIRIFCDPALVDSVDASVSIEVGIEELSAVIERVRN